MVFMTNRMEPMPQASDRDERGRMLPGHSGNPAGRPARAAHLRLLEAAEAVGATVLVMVPPASLRPTRRPTPPPDLPPAA
jgi:hypothetical protein